MSRPTRPDKALRSLIGAATAGGRPRPPAYASAAIRHPDRAAIVDERGTLTFAEVHRRTNALARELRAAGVSEGDGVAIMCRNHRGFIEATVACSKLGASALYLNTAFAGAADRRRARARATRWRVIYDEEFAELVGTGAAGASASSPGASPAPSRPSRCSRS